VNVNVTERDGKHKQRHRQMNMTLLGAIDPASNAYQARIKIAI